MAGRVEEHPDIVLRLAGSDRGSEGECLGDRGVEVCDLQVEAHHRALLPVDGRPHGGLVTGRLLQHDIDGSLGSGEDRRAAKEMDVALNRSLTTTTGRSPW